MSTPAESAPTADVTVEYEGQLSQVRWPAESTLLEALLDGGVDAPHSCTQGQCGACECVVEPAGESTAADVAEISMDYNVLLDNASVAQGYRLACQSRQHHGGSYRVSYDM